MSVIITAKVFGDTDAFQKAAINRADEFKQVSETGRSRGALHHRFGIGEGFIYVIDEWDAPEHFEAFFTDPKMQEFVASVGADPTIPPEITVTEAFPSADEF